MGNQLDHGFRAGLKRLLPLAALALTAAAPAPHPVIELRQYKIVHGQRDAMIALFDRYFVESQEATGARIVGQFRDRDDPDRFVWIRAFPDMTVRGTSLNAFYYGPVWQAHRDEANPKLDDNDNVLLLRPAAPDLGFAQAMGTRPAPGGKAAPAGMIVATIHYLWKAPDEGFTAFFRATMMPALKASGVEMLGAYVAEEEPNNFPRLPVRQGEKVFVWFARVADDSAWRRAQDKFAHATAVAAALDDYEERPAQRSRLAPTDRSLLR